MPPKMKTAGNIETNDRFVLAERDLKHGPGEFLGTRQAGFASNLRMASLTDVGLIEKARVHAQKLFAEDADLVNPAHALLKESLQRYWGAGKGDVS
jgi:ATP-dependent DNA helicase RecG